MYFKAFILSVLIVGYGYYTNYTHYELLNENVQAHINDLNEDNQSQLYISHQQRNSLYALGWCVFPVLTFILFYPEIRSCKRFCG